MSAQIRTLQPRSTVSGAGQHVRDNAFGVGGSAKPIANRADSSELETFVHILVAKDRRERTRLLVGAVSSCYSILRLHRSF
jgi:hypothetical protein